MGKHKPPPCAWVGRCIRLLGIAALQLALVSGASAGGIEFACDAAITMQLSSSVPAYFGVLGVDATLFTQTLDPATGLLQFTLVDKRPGNTGTLDLIHRREYALKEELVQLPGGHARPKTVVTVSQKEILLAMLQGGRRTLFTGAACTLQALQDQIGIRQNTVAWAEVLSWNWPEGRAARWNTRYWRKGALQPRVPLQRAVADVFMHPASYSVGCYTATKLITLQGILDYYRRIKKDPQTTALIVARLMHDHDPLSHVEPGAMWYFEAETTVQDLQHAGKLIQLSHSVPSNNFIPGDWTYFLNTDALTYRKTGYEGSNAIYLGRGKFDDYYNDNNHSYTYQEKLQEVYQWRHHVFSRERDVARIHPLTGYELDLLGNTPEQGGIELSYRAIPFQFGFEVLPKLPD